jgi:hypothetical protein
MVFRRILLSCSGCKRLCLFGHDVCAWAVRYRVKLTVPSSTFSRRSFTILASVR